LALSSTLTSPYFPPAIDCPAARRGGGGRVCTHDWDLSRDVRGADLGLSHAYPSPHLLAAGIFNVAADAAVTASATAATPDSSAATTATTASAATGATFVPAAAATSVVAISTAAFTTTNTTPTTTPTPISTPTA